MKRTLTGRKNLSAGFTLIELLVVIAIIGLLASIVMASLNSAKGKARDTRRVSDLKTISKALEIYNIDKNAYPASNNGGNWQSRCVSWDVDGGVSNYAFPGGNIIPALVPNYLPSVPTDPEMSASTNQNCYMYNTKAGTSDYKLIDYMLTSGNPTANIASQPSLVDPVQNAGTAWAPANPCTGAGTNWSWAIWSSDTSRCW